MNIEKLEAILHEMQAAQFDDLTAAQALVREWADRIGDAITAHLMAEIGGGVVAEPPQLSEEPGGHRWEDDEA